MNAVFGLRGLFSIWVMRGHFAIYGCNQDFEWWDTTNRWRVNIYVLLAGMTTAMLHDRTRESARDMIFKFVVPLLPVYYFAMIMTMPMQVTLLNCGENRNGVASVLVSALLQQGNYPFWQRGNALFRLPIFRVIALE